MISSPRVTAFTSLVVVLCSALTSSAGQPRVKLDVPPYDPKEPRLPAMSLVKAADYLDRVAREWMKPNSCGQCHANVYYMMARPGLPQTPTSILAQTRKFLEKQVAKPEANHPLSTRPVALAAALTFDDARATGKLEQSTQKALQQMWAGQYVQGGWGSGCGAFGNDAIVEVDSAVGIAAWGLLAVGNAPEDYARSREAQAGLQKLRTLVTKKSAESVYERSMLLWASLRVDGLMKPGQQDVVVKRLLELQHDDGGWNLEKLRNRDRSKDRQQWSDGSSDGYGTGFAIYVLRQAGIRATDPAITRGVSWLRKNQRASGRWFTPSQAVGDRTETDVGTRDLYVQNAGTAFAVMALRTCEIQAPKYDPTEALAKQASLTRAAQYLDRMAAFWMVKERAAPPHKHTFTSCGSCHANHGYLMARALLGNESQTPQVDETRRWFERRMEDFDRLKEEERGMMLTRDGGRVGISALEFVGIATGLAFHDARTTGKLHPTTRKALGKMWALQDAKGNWQMLDHCGTTGFPVVEFDQQYAATLAALAASTAPEGYAQTDEARAGLEKLRNYFKQHPDPNLHHRTMLLWASLRTEGLMTAAERQATIKELLKLQRADGGWSTASLAPARWSNRRTGFVDPNSDGYGTAFVVYVLRQAGLPAARPEIVRGVQWLKSHQGESGCWHTIQKRGHDDPEGGLGERGLSIENLGTAFAVMALKACEDPKYDPKEPVAARVSLAKSADCLDNLADFWMQTRKAPPEMNLGPGHPALTSCGSCHANFAYLMARPMLLKEFPQSQLDETRRWMEHRLTKSFDRLKQRPRRGVRAWEDDHRVDYSALEFVGTTTALVFHDAQTTGKLRPSTRSALTKMWTLQNGPGQNQWSIGSWSPAAGCGGGFPVVEFDQHYGATLAALAVGYAPDDYAKTKEATDGLAKLRTFFEKRPAANLHEKAMLLWASQRVDGLMTQEQCTATVHELLKLQRRDGGWSASGLHAGAFHDAGSDGYGTAFVVLVLRQAGVPASRPEIRRAVNWLKTHQRVSGGWFSPHGSGLDVPEGGLGTRGLSVTNLATAFAIMALKACGEADIVAEKNEP
jgi:squalene-hopene/tetraprenyl-beta-curcumene cyclase